MYTNTNYKTKKAMVEAFKTGEKISVHQPGPFPSPRSGVVTLEGPHYPKPHTWYARVKIDNNIIVEVLK